MNGKYSNYVLRGMRKMLNREDDDVDDDVDDDDQIITINDNSYTLSKKNSLKKQFKRADKPDCFIEFLFIRSTVWVDVWFCDDIKGTGRVLMKDFLTYLLQYRMKQPIYIDKNTKIQAYAVASIAKTFLHKRITKTDDKKID